MHILVADGDESVLQSIELMLKSEGFRAYGVNSGEEAEEIGRLYEYDAIVLSETEDRTPYDVVRSLRVVKVRTPILVLSGRSTLESTVHVLGLGADDHMTKPFHKTELIARLNALVRRSKGHVASKIEIGSLVLDLDAKSVTVSGEPLHFTGKEFLMLETLVLRAGQVLNKEAFLTALYGGMDEPEAKIIDVFVCKLRRKLARVGLGDLIKTVWGRGYLIEKPGASGKVAVGPEVKAAFNDGLNKRGGHRETPAHLSERGLRELVG